MARKHRSHPSGSSVTTLLPVTTSQVLNYIAAQKRAINHLEQNTKWEPQGDLRRWHPNKEFNPPHATRRDATVQKVQRYKSPFGHSTKYAVPKQIALCVRRKIRREIINVLLGAEARRGIGKAKQLARKWGGKKKHRNRYSGVHC